MQDGCTCLSLIQTFLSLGCWTSNPRSTGKPRKHHLLWVDVSYSQLGYHRIPIENPLFPIYGNTQNTCTFVISEQWIPSAYGKLSSLDGWRSMVVWLSPKHHGWLHASRESIDKVQEQLPVPMTLSKFSCCYVLLRHISQIRNEHILPTWIFSKIVLRIRSFRMAKFLM